MAIGVNQYATAADGNSLSPALASSTSPSSSQVPEKHRQRAIEKEKADTLYGSDDLTDMNDLLYREDLFEDVRRATEMESYGGRRKSVGLFMGCFDFLKIILSFKS